MLLELIIPFAILISGLNAECPQIDSLPVLNDAGDNFYCAFNWIGDIYPWDHDIPLEACNDGQYDYMDGFDNPGTDNRHFLQVGGLIVKAGCTFYGYSNANYGGSLTQYFGPATFPNGCSGGNCPSDHNSEYWGYSSIRCRCKQEPIICQPSDHWVTIMQCDNSNNDVEAKCSYTKTIGTTWTTEVTNSFEIDATVETAMSAAFFKFFEEDIAISASTGYDWTHTSSEAKSETEDFKVEAVVKSHSILIIEGAEGECGGNNVKTELFRLTSTDAAGNILSQTLEYLN